MNARPMMATDLAGSGSMTQVLRAYLEETRCEMLRFARNPGLVIPVLIMPVALYALFALVISAEAMRKDPIVGMFLFAAFAVMATSMPALFGMSSSLAMEREMGLLRLRRAQPAPAGSWLAAKIICGLGFGAIAYLPLLAVALASGNLALAPVVVVKLSVVLIACAAPFCALGLMIGTLVKGSAAPGYANLIYLPGCYLSGMFFPLPASMHWQVPIWPQFHVIQVAMHVADAKKLQFEPFAVAVASVVGFTVLFSAVAIWRLARKG